MQTTKKKLSDTNVQLTLIADDRLLEDVREETLRHLSRTVRIAGFRPGKAPLALVEKNTDAAVMQSEFLDRALNRMYADALREYDLRPVVQPKVTVRKFVPYTTLEITAEVEAVGELKLADYKKIKMAKKPVVISDKDVDGVLDQLRKREAVKTEQERPARAGDEVVIDFKGTDTKTNEPISGGEGKDYPLQLGSNTFIPGFETNLIGAKAGDEKTFSIVFPKDYGVAALQNRKASFTVTVKKVHEIVLPTADDAFAAKAGPFKNLEALKADIRKQLQTEKEYQADREYTDSLLTKITNDSKVAIPQTLIDEQLDHMTDEQKRSLAYRGMTWQEFLDSQKLTEDTYRKQIHPDALLRVKAGLILGAVADREGITLTREELDGRIAALKEQYTDPQMRAELDKTEARREIASRIISEKTADLLVGYATAAK